MTKERPTVEKGSPAPDFTLPSDGGGDVILASLRGKKVVLYFYPSAPMHIVIEAEGFLRCLAKLLEAGFPISRAWSQPGG